MESDKSGCSFTIKFRVTCARVNAPLSIRCIFNSLHRAYVRPASGLPPPHPITFWCLRCSGEKVRLEGRKDTTGQIVHSRTICDVLVCGMYIYIYIYVTYIAIINWQKMARVQRPRLSSVASQPRDFKDRFASRCRTWSINQRTRDTRKFSSAIFLEITSFSNWQFHRTRWFDFCRNRKFPYRSSQLLFATRLIFRTFRLENNVEREWNVENTWKRKCRE